MKYRTILFDLDGTIVDAFTTIHRAFCHTLPQFGRPAPSLDDVRRAVGGGLRNAIARFLPEEQVDEALPIHLAYSTKILLDDVRPLEGALDLLRDLHARGCTLAVFTNKHGDSARKICTHLGFSPYLTAVYGAGDTPWVKPDPRLASFVLKELHATPATTLLIGDSPYDAETAHKADITCWCVTTGTHDAKELQTTSANRIFPNLTDIHIALTENDF